MLVVSMAERYLLYRWLEAGKLIVRHILILHADEQSNYIAEIIANSHA
jgi:hypothetical protein